MCRTTDSSFQSTNTLNTTGVWSLIALKKGKGRYSSSWEPHLRHTGCHLPYGNTQCYLPPNTSECAPPNRSHAGWNSIYLPLRDGRLSWPSWLDSALAGSWTSDLSITSPTPNRCTTKTTLAITYRHQDCYLIGIVLGVTKSQWKKLSPNNNSIQYLRISPSIILTLVYSNILICEVIIPRRCSDARLSGNVAKQWLQAGFQRAGCQLLDQIHNKLSAVSGSMRSADPMPYNTETDK